MPIQNVYGKRDIFYVESDIICMWVVILHKLESETKIDIITLDMVFINLETSKFGIPLKNWYINMCHILIQKNV